MANYSIDQQYIDSKLTDKEMLKRDVDAMDYNEALNYLTMCNDLSLFDPMTGETESLFNYKHFTNVDNYKTYVAIEKAKYLLTEKLNENK